MVHAGMPFTLAAPLKHLQRSGNQIQGPSLSVLASKERLHIGLVLLGNLCKTYQCQYFVKDKKKKKEDKRERRMELKK